MTFCVLQLSLSSSSTGNVCSHVARVRLSPGRCSYLTLFYSSASSGATVVPHLCHQAMHGADLPSLSLSLLGIHLGGVSPQWCSFLSVPLSWSYATYTANAASPYGRPGKLYLQVQMTAVFRRLAGLRGQDMITVKVYRNF